MNRAESGARIHYRDARARDGADQAEVFYHAVMQGSHTYYTKAQRRAWALALPREASAWRARQALYTTLVASCDNRCVGFVEIDMPAARIETLYVWPSLARRGIGSTLLIHAERAMRERGIDTVSIAASLMLADGLERRGWQRLGEERVDRGGESLPRVRMEKRLSLVET